MGKLNIEELRELRVVSKKERNFQKTEFAAKITVHMGTCGIASGAGDVLKALQNKIKELKLENIYLKTSGCAGLCSHEPMVTVEMKNYPPVKYIRVNAEIMQLILTQHVIKGRIVTENALAIGCEKLG